MFLNNSLLLKSRCCCSCFYCFLSRKSGAADGSVMGLKISLTENNILISTSISQGTSQFYYYSFRLNPSRFQIKCQTQNKNVEKGGLLLRGSYFFISAYYIFSRKFCESLPCCLLHRQVTNHFKKTYCNNSFF